MLRKIALLLEKTDIVNKEVLIISDSIHIWNFDNTPNEIIHKIGNDVLFDWAIYVPIIYTDLIRNLKGKYKKRIDLAEGCIALFDGNLFLEKNNDMEISKKEKNEQ